MKFNESFYPTPASLIRRMVEKINWNKVNYVCEPSAGDGAILKYIRDNKSRWGFHLHAIEKDENLRNMLIGAGEKVVGKDFLTYAGLIQFDAIIMNPPFSNGDAHLLKAIEIMYSGQIVCLLNAETLRNPNTNRRVDLASRLRDLNAEIEYIQNAFIDAERKTAVEIAMVTIKIEREVEDDLLAGAEDRVRDFEPEEVDGQIKDVASRDSIVSIVDDYIFRVRMGIETIQNFYRNHKYIGGYITLTTDEKDSGTGSLTDVLKNKTNFFLQNIRRAYWKKTMFLPQFQKKLTEKKQKEFQESLKNNSDLEFTEPNVRAFFENLMDSYEDTLREAIEDVFEKFTSKHAWDESIHCKNVHYYNGWKTNDAFKVNKRVIVPYVGIDNDWGSVYKIGYSNKVKLDDIDKVMNYFCGKTGYVSITAAADASPDILKVLESEYFMIRFYKKGTTHLTFKSEEIRRRFNIEVGKKKGWLPQNYGYTPMRELAHEEQEIVSSFEDKVEDYDANLNQIGIVKKDMLMIEAA